MRWVSVLSEHKDSLKALEECLGKVEEKETPPDLAILFPSPHHAKAYERLPEIVYKRLGARHIVGCSGGGIIAGGREVEHRPAMGLMLAWLPGAEIRPFRLTQESMPSPDAPPKAWRDWIGVSDPSEKPSFMILADPFSLDAEELIRGLDYAFPATVKVGGLASGAGQPGDNALYIDQKTFSSGAVGVAFTGNIEIDPLVAQGCRPIGKPCKVTACEKNLLLELDGRTPIETLERLIGELSPEDQALARTSLFLGVLNDPMKSGESKQDFLIRNLVGLDPRRGILAVGALLRPGQTVQFHLRDRRTSAADLEEHLSLYLDQAGGVRPVGAVLFSCLGRGQHLYQKENHDTDLFLKMIGKVPVGGFFCNGEIGPVDGSTYLHGFTSCFGIFRPKVSA